MPSRLDRSPSRPLPGWGRLVVAASLRARLLGLAFLAALPAGRALWLPRCRSVHTLGMRFALDLVWLDGRGRPLRVDRGVRPGRVRTCLRARSVVETAAGEGERMAAALAAARGGEAPAAARPRRGASRGSPRDRDGRSGIAAQTNGHSATTN